MEKKQSLPAYVWQIASSHMIAYFIAGVLAYYFMNYKEYYSSQSLSLLMRPTDSPWVAIGSGLQLFRGAIIAVVLYPFKKVFLEEKYGAAKLSLLISGLSFLSTIGPAPGSFEGYLYTILPVQYHLLGIPETIIYVGLFSIMVVWRYKNQKKVYTVLSIIFILLIILMSTMGFLKAIGYLKV
jgi:hypothetical protein